MAKELTKLQVCYDKEWTKLAIPASHSILTPGQPVTAPQTTRVLIPSKQLVSLDQERQGAIPESPDRLIDLVVKASSSRAADPGFDSGLRRGFSGSSHTSDVKIGTPVAALPGAWRSRVSAGTGWPGISIL